MLKNKVAVIYGAGGGIGSAVARAFANEGAKVFLTGLHGQRSKPSLKALLPPAGPLKRRKSMLSTSRPSTDIYSRSSIRRAASISRSMRSQFRMRSS